MNRHQSADHIGALFASFFYTCKPGNLAAIIFTASLIGFIYIWHLGSIKGFEVPLMPQFFALIVILLFVAKITDNSARICAGLDKEPVPLGLFDMVNAQNALFLLIGLFLLGSIFILAANYLHLSPWTHGKIILGVGVAAHFLVPACIYTYITEGNIRPLTVLRATGSIGIGRYLVMTIISLVFTIAVVYLNTRLNDRKYGIISSEIMALQEGYHSFHLYWYFISNFILFTFTAAVNGHYYAFLYPRSMTTDDGDLDDSAILATLSAAGMTPPAAQNTAPVPSNHLPPADLTLLQDADTSGMDMDTQQAFARALAEADAHIRSGAPDKAIPILAAWTTARHSIAAYFPAYARLYPLDPQPALRSRLLEAAARGNSKSYRLIAAELASLDPADIPVNHILPLVQLAAKAQEHRSVINLTRNFGKAHPEHPHLVENYYHAARALAKLGATDKATALLSQLLTRYPEHPKAPHIRYALDQLGGKT